MKYLLLLFLFTHLSIAQDETHTTPDVSYLTELMRVFAMKKSDHHEALKIFSCDSADKTWVEFAMKSNGVVKEYVMGKNCDISGVIRGSFFDPFPVLLEIKNLGPMKHASMKVDLNIFQKRSDIIYSFRIRDGLLSSDEKLLSFNADYHCVIDPFTGKTRPGSEKGTLTLVKRDGKYLNLTEPFVFEH